MNENAIDKRKAILLAYAARLEGKSDDPHRAAYILLKSLGDGLSLSEACARAQKQAEVSSGAKLMDNIWPVLKSLMPQDVLDPEKDTYPKAPHTAAGVMVVAQLIADSSRGQMTMKHACGIAGIPETAPLVAGVKSLGLTYGERNVGKRRTKGLALS